MDKAKLPRNFFELRVLFHSLGIGSLAGAVFLQFLVFMGISSRGEFMGVEKNPLILNSEIGLTCFCALYLLYLAVFSIRSLLRSKA